MIVPTISIDPAGTPDLSQTASLAETYARAATVLFAITDLDTVKAALDASLFRSPRSWVQFPPVSTADSEEFKTLLTNALNAGALRVVLESSLEQLSSFQQQLREWGFPADRVVVSYEVANEHQVHQVVTALQDLVNGYVFKVGFSPKAASDVEKLVKTVKEVSRSSGKPKHPDVVVSFDEVSTLTLDSIKTLHGFGADIIVPSNLLTTTPSSQPEAGSPKKLNLGEAFACVLASDRADGLFPTVVADSHGIALGLCYSSLESIVEALRSGRGVYQSRSRKSLWIKGESSGAVQKLLRIDVDCDHDALKFTVEQADPGFCHHATRTCFGEDTGISALFRLLHHRLQSAPPQSYTKRLFDDSELLHSKIMEEAQELCEASTPADIAWEAADLIYFALVKCAKSGVHLADIEKQLDLRSLKVTRRPGDAKVKSPQTQSGVNGATATNETSAATTQSTKAPQTATAEDTASSKPEIRMTTYEWSTLSAADQQSLLRRPIMRTEEIMSRVEPILRDVRERGDAALLDLTLKFDRVQLSSPVIRAPFDQAIIDSVKPEVRKAIDQAYENVYKFHKAQLDESAVLTVEIMPGVVCSRFARPIERVGLYIPGGTAVLPSSALMLGVPAKVAGCREIVFATPPRKDGSVVPEVLYVAHKVGASTVVVAGGAQAVGAMAYGTESVPKVDKICGPGNQYVTAAKMMVQNDTSALVSIDMPAGPSELLVIADEASNPAYVASDLLSQAEHGPDSQVILLAVNISPAHLSLIHEQIRLQGEALPRSDIVRLSIRNSRTIKVDTMEKALEISNAYAPEHLILHVEGAEAVVDGVMNAGSVFVGPYSPESCGDYASGTNHTLPTYGYARMYSGVNTTTFVKYITSQNLTSEGLDRLGDVVTTLAEIEELEGHRNAVAIRLKDIRKGRE
ncbi:trifunctional histidinol dehydrogenase [Quaeritorhiza haematococci]|nr:trifunctional histidinol dehydrogenase [Quaeritorhiza haematococci]